MKGMWTFRLWLIVIMATACQAGSHGGNKTEPKVLIVGAGLSGITAAKTIDDAGYSNFLLIEGSSRVGGRLKSSSLSGYTVEHGAMWIYGKGSNPMYQLLKQHDISRVDAQDTMTVRNNNGNNVTSLVDDSQSKFDSAIDEVDTEAKVAVADKLPDFTLDSRLRYYNWSIKTDVDKVIEIYNIDFEFSVPPPYLSGKHAYFWAPYEAFDSEDIEILDDTKGYESLVHKLGEEFLGNGTDNDHIVYNKKVTEIKHSKDGVEVKTSDGTVYTGDYVIVTTSLGVLQNKEVAFNPELPMCKQKAIDQFGMSYLTQIYLKFSTSFWDDTATILYASPQRGKYPTWINMNKILPGSNILQLSISAEESRLAERRTDQVVIDDIMVHLRLMYQDRTVPDPEDFVISKWTYDPLYYGAYSYWPTGFTQDNMADMMAPVGRVYFAGEHLDPIQYSFAHGAYASGFKTGNDLTSCLQNQELCIQRLEFPFHCSKTETNDCSSTNGVKSSIYASCRAVLLFSLLSYLALY